MSYGTRAFGTTSYAGGGSANFTLLPYLNRAAGGYDGQLEFTGEATFFSLFLRKSSEETDVTIEAFTRNDLDETPQPQGTFGGLFAQHVIPAARYISVRATLGGAGDFIEVRGRPGD